jgi:hypothetical protein
VAQPGRISGSKWQRGLAALRLLYEWAALIVRTEDGDVAVAPSATPGGLACLYQAFCTGCGATTSARSGYRPHLGTAAA